MIEYLQACLPSICVRLSCLKQSKTDKFYQYARERLNDELDIVKLIQLHRLFRQALSILLTKDKIEDLKSACEKLDVEKGSDYVE